MKKSSILFLIFICFGFFYVKGENTHDYTVYHRYINKAEDFFYSYNQVDSCLHYYDLAFDGFTFNWVHDLVNAAQIAYFSNKEYKPYIYRAYNFGLQAKHLKQIPLFLPDCIDEFEQFEQTSSYREIRNKYLKSINIECLDWVYGLAIEDQSIYRSQSKSDFIFWWNKQILELTAKINQYGFPGNKIIGIESSTVFAELGEPDKDMSERVLKHKNRRFLCHEHEPDFHVFGKDTIWFESDSNINRCHNVSDNTLGVRCIMVCMRHYFRIHEVSKASHDSVHNQLLIVWLQEIGKGNMHPREMAALHDDVHRIVDESSIANVIGTHNKGIGEIFGINHITTFDGSFDVNEFRAKYNIVSLEIDSKKKEYEKKHGFKLFWGFEKCL